MFGPFIEVSDWLYDNTPRPRHIWDKVSAPFKKRKKFQFHFITWHYVYIIFLALFGAILVFPTSDIPFVDALFFSAGAATQSGLNTIDINLLNTEQQVVLLLISCIANPIFIHGSLVFLRLYWFEKRFQNIVQDARNLRRTRTATRSRSEARASHDAERDVEEGINGREIRVLRQADGHVRGHALKEGLDVTEPSMSPTAAGSSSTENNNQHATNGEKLPREGSDDYYTTPPASASEFPPLEVQVQEETPGGFHRDIMFADEVVPQRLKAQTIASSPIQRLPEMRPTEHHIAFVEHQRNRSNTGTLRIPGPRDFDRGDVPHRIDEDLSRNISAVTSPISPRRVGDSNLGNLDEDGKGDSNLNRNITIEEPRPLSRLRSGIASHLHLGRSHTENDGERSGLRQRARTFATMTTARTQEKDDPMPYLSWAPTMGRNSAFVDLSEEQREELGGIEYRALKTLAWLLVIYYLGFHIFGIVSLLPWIKSIPGRAKIVTDAGQNPSWWGVFTAISMFNDLGFTITPDSMISFQSAVWPLLLGSFLIIIGNTGFPCMLRFSIWLTSWLVPRGSAIWEELRFLLDHPRRCFTLLFPSDATWWLFWVLVLLNGVDIIFFIILDINDPTVTSLPPGVRVLDGLFQAASTRTAGFSVVNLAELHPAIQVSYLIMMYISVFPIAISVRRTNVYEEKSLGIYGEEDDNADSGDSKGASYVGFHLRRQLSFDLWFVFLGFFLISIIEGSHLENTNEYAFSLFSVLFEIISAYGTVGLSLGYPGFNASFSAQFSTLSKLIIIVMMIRGRHRGLPYALDRAILLPSEGLKKREEDHEKWRRARRNSMLSSEAVPPMGVGAQSIALGRSNTGFSNASVPGARRPSAGSESMPRLKVRTNTSRFGGFISGALSAGPTLPRDGIKRA